MPIYHVFELRLGRLQVKEWRRRALHTLGLLILALVGYMVGLFFLDPQIILLRDVQLYRIGLEAA